MSGTLRISETRTKRGKKKHRVTGPSMVNLRRYDLVHHEAPRQMLHRSDVAGQGATIVTFDLSEATCGIFFVFAYDVFLKDAV